MTTDPMKRTENSESEKIPLEMTHGSTIAYVERLFKASCASGEQTTSTSFTDKTKGRAPGSKVETVLNDERETNQETYQTISVQGDHRDCN